MKRRSTKVALRARAARKVAKASRKQNRNH